MHVHSLSIKRNRLSFEMNLLYIPTTTIMKYQLFIPIHLVHVIELHFLYVWTSSKFIYYFHEIILHNNVIRWRFHLYSAIHKWHRWRFHLYKYNTQMTYPFLSTMQPFIATTWRRWGERFSNTRTMYSDKFSPSSNVYKIIPRFFWLLPRAQNLQIHYKENNKDHGNSPPNHRPLKRPPLS